MRVGRRWSRSLGKCSNGCRATAPGRPRVDPGPASLTPRRAARGRAAGATTTSAGESVDSRQLADKMGTQAPFLLADCDPLRRDSWALLAALLSVSGLCVLCALCGSSLSQRQKQRGTTEDTENTEQSKPKGGSRAPGSCVARRAAWPFVAQTPRGTSA
jgi:hypothetical protein